VWHRNWLSDAFYFYGVDGKRIGTYYWDGTDAQLSLDTNNGPEIYFRGRLQGPAQDQVGSVGGGGSYPYGESYSPFSGNTDTVGFATYVGDATGLDYAWNRYYSSTLGRFLSPDPSMDNVDYGNSASWNAYAYTNDDPTDFSDPSGLIACGDISVGGGTLRGAVLADTAQGRFIDLVWHEGGTLSQAGGDFYSWVAGFDLIAQAIWNRLQIVSGHVSVTGANGTVYSVANGNVSQLGYLPSPHGRHGTATLDNVLLKVAADTGVLTATGRLANDKYGNLAGLKADLNQDQGDLSYSSTRPIALVNASSGQIEGYVTPDCFSVIQAMWAANGAAAGTLNLNTPTFFPTSWNSSAPINNPNCSASAGNGERVLPLR
jgi:RHS repeat-associated protein